MRSISISKLFFFITVLVTLLAFLSLKDFQWNTNWLQILVSLAIGFLLGVVFSKKKRKKIWY